MKIDVFIATNNFPAGVIEAPEGASEASIVETAKDLSRVAAHIIAHPHWYAHIERRRAPGEKEFQRVLVFYDS